MNEKFKEAYNDLDELARDKSSQENGKSELVEDPNEAQEIAHATKEMEEQYRRALGGYARVAVGDSGNWDAREERMRDVVRQRIETDKIGNASSEAYKNGAEFLDLSSGEFTAALAEAPIYRKAATVKARPAERGELVVTQTSTVEEGKNTQKEDGDMVVTGVNGADFILPAEKFNKLYEETDESGTFQSRGMARIIDNPTGKKIGILAPWGEMQYGDSESKIAVQYDPQNPDVVGTDRYILDKTEFAAYKDAEPTVQR